MDGRTYRHHEFEFDEPESLVRGVLPGVLQPKEHHQFETEKHAIQRTEN